MGDAPDNAVAELFFALMQAELLNLRRIHDSRIQIENTMRERIEVFPDREHPASTLD